MIKITKIKFKMPDGNMLTLNKVSGNRYKFVAKSPQYLSIFNIGNISVDELFDKFSRKEKIAILYHELWHYHNNFKTEMKMYLKKPYTIFYTKPICYKQEFEADTYARKMAGKISTLKVLSKLKKFLEEGRIPKSHEKFHPPIQERINIIRRS